MLTLLAECHFWTNNNDININDNDFGAFKYYTKKDFQQNNCEQQNNTLAEAKKEYHENRNGIVIIKNDKELRLKDNLRKLEDLIKTYKIIKSEWKDSCIIQILLSNGVLVYICVNRMTGDILNMKFDKYFVGKLASDTITDAIFSNENILLAYNTNQLTLVNFQKPNYRKCPEKISNMEPKIYHILLPGQTEKKIKRHLLINNNFDLIVVWTKSSQNEIFPWRPTVEDQEHSNMHVFKLKSGKLETIGYCWTENDPIYTQFLMTNNGKILTIEQKVSRKGDITAEICFYIIGSKSRKLSRTGVKTISIRTQICCCSLSPDEEKLLIGTIDQFIYINNLLRSATNISMKTDIIPTQCVWHPDSAILIIGNDRSQFQCYDFALNAISIKLISENVIQSSNLLDLSKYFTIPINLLNITFSKKPDLKDYTELYAEQTDFFLMLLYENGPIVCMKFFSSTCILGDLHSCGLTFDILCYQYLRIKQLEYCVKLLCATNWEIYGSMCLLTLQRITNFVLTQIEPKQNHQNLLMQALGSFTDDLNEDVRDKFCDAIIDLKRKLFFFLLRNDLYKDCFNLAQNIEEYDLFMDLYNCTKFDPKLIDFSNASYEQAKLILEKNENDDNSEEDDTISLTSSQSSTTSDDYFQKPLTHKTYELSKNVPSTSLSSSQQQYLSVKRYQQKQQPNSNNNHKFQFKSIDSTIAGVSNLKNYVPPLPYFKSPILNAENIKINKPKLQIKNSKEIKLKNFNQNNNNFIGKFKHLKIPSYPELNNNIDDIEFNSSIPSTSKNYPNQFQSNSVQYNTITRNQQQQNSLTQRDNYQLGIISTSFNESEDELPSNWRPNIPDQTIGIPTSISSNELFEYESLPLSNNLEQHIPSRIEINPANDDLKSIDVLNKHSILNNISTNRLSLTNNSPESENIYSTKYYHHYPLVLGNIPSSSISNSINIGMDVLLKNRKPSGSILSNSSSNGMSSGGSSLGGFKDLPLYEQNKIISNNGNLCKKDSGIEKNKVKFSDTVQVAVVPEILRKEKPKQSKTNGFLDPKKELADSLPLCHPNDEYLKDFNPLPPENLSTNLINNNDSTEQRTENNASNNNISNNSNNDNNNRSTPIIKVVHFGVV